MFIIDNFIIQRNKIMFNSKKPDTFTPSKAPTTPTRPVVNNVSRSIVSSEQKVKSNTTISTGCIIKGDVSGNDDMNIFGKIDGTISLNNNTLTVEKSATVSATISAKIVNINGNITGNIEASEKIIITDTGNVTGDLSAPKVILKDGSYFRGNVSMSDNKIDTNSKNDIKAVKKN